MEYQNNNQPKTAQRTCDHCGSTYTVELGATKANFNKLMRMPTMSEWIELFIIIMVIFCAFAYKIDIANLKDYYQDQCTASQINTPSQKLTGLNISLPDDFNTKNCVANPDSCLINIDTPLVGNDTDAYGCIGSAGYSWCSNKSRCIRVWEENCSR